MAISEDPQIMDLDETLDQLIANAEVLNNIEDKENLDKEKESLIDIQESLLNHLLHLNVDTQNKDMAHPKLDEYSLLIEKTKRDPLRQYHVKSVFKKRAIVRKSRMKQAL